MKKKEEARKKKGIIVHLKLVFKLKDILTKCIQRFCKSYNKNKKKKKRKRVWQIVSWIRLRGGNDTRSFNLTRL